MTFGAPDRARYDELMAKKANRKSGSSIDPFNRQPSNSAFRQPTENRGPTVPGPVGTSASSINPFNTQPDTSAFLQPTENTGPTVPEYTTRADPKPAPTPVSTPSNPKPDPKPAPTPKTKVDFSFKNPKTEYEKTIHSIEKDFNKGNISEAMLGRLKEEAAEAKYGPKADLSQFDELLGELEDSKMKQERQRSVEGNRDIFAEGAASMMSNF